MVEARRAAAAAEVRHKLESLQLTVSEQLIHIDGHDELVSAGFVENPVEARSIFDSWRAFMDEHRDEYIALQAYYAQPFSVALAEGHQGTRGGHRPPAVAPDARAVWSAYEALDDDHVRATAASSTPTWSGSSATPWNRTTNSCRYEEVVKQRFRWWLDEQAQTGESSAPNSCAG